MTWGGIERCYTQQGVGLRSSQCQDSFAAYSYHLIFHRRLSLWVSSLVDHFYIALFSAHKQIDCALVSCYFESVTIGILQCFFGYHRCGVLTALFVYYINTWLVPGAMVPSQDKSLMQTSLSFCFGDKGTALQSTDFDQLWVLTLVTDAELKLDRTCFGLTIVMAHANHGSADIQSTWQH